MNLGVGIAGKHRGWELLLGQIGVPFEFLTSAPTVQSYTVLVAGDDCEHLDWLTTFIDQGGAVLSSGSVFAKLSKTSSATRRLRYLLPRADSIFAGSGLVDLDTNCFIPHDANELVDERGMPSAFAGAFGNGTIVALPFDPASSVVDFRTSDRSFYAAAPRLAFEKISTVNRGGIRKIVTRALEHLHRQRGLPFVHLWHFPKDAPTQFAFRVDTDFAYDSEVKLLYEQSLKFQIPMTWFVDVRSQELHLKMFAEMHGHDVGAHGYEHKEFKSSNEYRADILRALEVLERHGIETTSYAAPYGNWNHDLQRVLHEYRFVYSSEFRYDADNLPSFPLLDGLRSTALQVPVHPISVGTLRRQGYSEDELREYFLAVLERTRAARDPLFVYYRPGDGFNRVLESVFDWVRSKNPHITTLGAYAAWWKKREALKLRIALEPHFLRVQTDRADDSVWLRVLDTNGKEAFTPLTSEIPLAALRWKPAPKPLEPPSDIRRVREFNYRIPLTKAVDFVGRLLR